MPRWKVYVARTLPVPVMEAFAARFDMVGESEPGPPRPEVLAAQIRDADAMVCTLTELIDGALLEQASRLRIIANFAVGYNNIDLEAARRRGVAVSNTPDILTETTADLTWALLLGVARRMLEGHSMVQTGQWPGWAPNQLLGMDLQGQTLGIVGMGRIGQAVARRADGFGMEVLYVTRRGTPASRSARWSACSLDELLARSDVVTLHLPLTAETRHLIGACELQRMKRTAILLNTARGAIIDEAALIQALDEGTIAAAGLDVYEHEPVVPGGLLGRPNVVTLPHLGSATLATRIRMGMMCYDNVVAVQEGRPAPNRVV